ncbi:hypothetical protein GCM10010124_31790 [Pilimelia terevasa]|uniref:Uncharacterized protein n=1 Tax=Pilimelia terevasa TaxID=53372 RepID=A0A8J3BT60_9ACTN|nr:hypothetical protein [Pilimelia terevasa]GGK36772.1 hypothetical protein GCM10010124_31790 [Pilimelia terevasa]
MLPTDEKRVDSPAAADQHAHKTPAGQQDQDAIPKNTRDAVAHLLRQDPSLDAGAIAERLGRHPSTVRRHNMPEAIKRSRDTDTP